MLIDAEVGTRLSMDIELSVSVLLVMDSCISLQRGVIEDGSGEFGA